MYYSLKDVFDRKLTDVTFYDSEVFSKTTPPKGSKVVDDDSNVWIIVDVLYTQTKYSVPIIEYTLRKCEYKAERTIIQQIHDIINDKTIIVKDVKSIAFKDKKFDEYRIHWVIPVDWNNHSDLKNAHMKVSYSTGSWWFKCFTPEWQEEVLEKVKNSDYYIIKGND